MPLSTIPDEIMGRLDHLIEKGMEPDALYRMAAELVVRGKEAERLGLKLGEVAALAFDLVICGRGAERVATGREYGNAEGTCEVVG